MGHKKQLMRIMQDGTIEEQTTRHRWIAFYRIWRACQKHPKAHFTTLEVAFMAFEDRELRRFRKCADAPGDTLGLTSSPVLRKVFLRGRRRKRLFGSFADSRYEACQRAARRCHTMGLETTPEEVAEIRLKIIRMVREKAREAKVEIPLDDDDLLRWLKQSY